MFKIGVVLSGCGVMDGAEIHESVLTLLALSKHGAEAVCMAPDINQKEVINHLTGAAVKETRNVLAESARIARGKIKDIKTVKVSEIDALIFPGGYGAAKNLCSFASDGADCTVQPDVARLAREIHAAGKPIGAICIAPVLAAKIFEGSPAKLTIGNEKEPAAQIERMGHDHIDCGVMEIVVDAKQKIVSTPAYMLAQNLSEAYAGIEKLVVEILTMAKQNMGKNK